MGRRGGLFSPLYKRTRMKLLAVESGALPAPDGAPAVETGRHADDAALRSAMVEAKHWEEGEMEARRRLGDVCYMVMDGGRCVHYSWLSRRRLYISELGYRAELPADGRWIYNSYTFPTHRGRSIFPRVLKEIARDVAREGDGILWAGVEDTNVASLRGITKAGFVEVLTLENVIFSRVELRRGKTVVDARLAGRFESMPHTWGRA